MWQEKRSGQCIHDKFIYVSDGVYNVELHCSCILLLLKICSIYKCTCQSIAHLSLLEVQAQKHRHSLFHLRRDTYLSQHGSTKDSSLLKSYKYRQFILNSGKVQLFNYKCILVPYMCFYLLLKYYFMVIETRFCCLFIQIF